MPRPSLIGLISIALLLGLLISAHSQSLPSDNHRGELIEKVTCADKPGQSYALYVPSYYSSDKRWPVLYALDPGARGKLPIEHLKDGAEKYGWIVAGSNNSRNGPIQQSIDAMNAMWNDTHQRFVIDDRRIYFAGFSGGARAAVTIATACGECAAGVIAGGAGFPAGLAPSPATQFAFFGTVGIEDFNFPELKNLEEVLTTSGVPHQIKVFDGRHEWAPPAIMTEAVEWMELRAMRAGTVARNNAIINELWQESMRRAEELEAAKEFYEAYQVYLSVANAFPSLHDLTQVEKKIVSLGSSREVKDAMRREEQEIKKQRELESQIHRLLSGRTGNASVFSDDNPGANGGATDLQRNTRAPADINNQSSSAEDDAGSLSAKNKLQSMFADLEKAARSAPDTSERRVARRVTGGLYVALFEQGVNLLETQKRYAAAVRIFELATNLAPDRSGAFYYLASALALNGEKKRALQALNQAVDKGFSDSGAIKTNKAFDSLRKERAYQQIIQKLDAAR